MFFITRKIFTPLIDSKLFLYFLNELKSYLCDVENQNILNKSSKNITSSLSFSSIFHFCADKSLAEIYGIISGRQTSPLYVVRR